jgi:hypothetical protein
VAICWLDVLLFFSFVFIGMALWSGAERFVSWKHRHEKPLIETYQQSSDVPRHQAELAIAQDQLKTLQSKLFELRTEASRLSVELKERRKISKSEQDRAAPSDREQRLKLATTNAMVLSLENDVPRAMQRIVTTAGAAANAKNSADVAFLKALEAFDMNNRKAVFWIGLASWIVLMILTWIACGMLKKRIGRGSSAAVLVPGAIVFAAVCLYHFVR